MQYHRRWFTRRTIAAMGLTAVLVACNDDDNVLLTVPTTFSTFTVTKLVSDAPGAGASVVDPHLVNPWGIVFNPSGILWVANNGTGTATLYAQDGTPQSLVVDIPTTGSPTGGKPTGQVFNSTTGFTLTGGNPALFIFSGEDGIISAWNTGTNALVVSDRSTSHSVYKGLAMGTSNGANFLYATDFHNGVIDMFDSNFGFVKSFTDPNIPAGFAPFGIQNIGGRLVVTYAKQLAPDNEDDEAGVGNGFVDVFNTDGTVSSRFLSNGHLNSPWAVTIAPSGFGTLAGAVLVGNFGDGLINAYEPSTGAFIDVLRDGTGTPITLDGLWSLVPGPAASSNVLFFSAGPNSETHGLLGTITVR